MSDGLVVADLAVGYRRRAPVLRGVAFEAPRSRITALIGANGSGKSTLLHSLLGLVERSAGSVELDGVPLVDRQRSAVGFCADDLPLPELLTGAEFVRLMTSLRGVHVETPRLEALFSALNMHGAERRLLKEYSHGMKRKAQLLANVLHRPELLVLDEPFRGLDPESHALVLGLLERYVDSGRIVLLSTHDLGLAATLCRGAVVVEGGSTRSVAIGEGDLLASPGGAEAALAAGDRARRFIELLEPAGASDAPTPGDVPHVRDVAASQ
jgi:ABC-2 type transport system ATP-binding protein